MKKKVFFITGDYWHHAETIRPLSDKLFSDDIWDVDFTEYPEDMLKLESAPDLIISFKDPIENDQIPTPVWCDDTWTQRLFDYVENQGTGFLAVHAALTDLEQNHPIISKMTQAVFLGHPEPCKLIFRPCKKHIITNGISEFVFPENDEHYAMSMIKNAEIDVLAETVSINGVQPGMWIKQLGKGRICCITPGHTTNNLLYDSYVKLMKNASLWCCRLL